MGGISLLLAEYLHKPLRGKQILLKRIHKEDAISAIRKTNMEEEKKGVIEGQGEPALTPEPESPVEPAEVPVEEQPKGSENIDFSRELAELEAKRPKKTELEKALWTARSLKKRIEDLGGDVSEIFPSSKEETPEEQYVTKRDLAAAHARTLASGDDETKVIMWHYDHSLQKTGIIEDDIERAYILANRGKLKTAYSEIMRSRVTPPSFSRGSGQIIASTKIPEMSQDQQAVLRKRGFSFNGTTRRWEARFNAYRYDPATNSWVSERK